MFSVSRQRFLFANAKRWLDSTLSPHLKFISLFACWFDFGVLFRIDWLISDLHVNNGTRITTVVEHVRQRIPGWSDYTEWKSTTVCNIGNFSCQLIPFVLHVCLGNMLECPVTYAAYRNSRTASFHTHSPAILLSWTIYWLFFTFSWTAAAGNKSNRCRNGAHLHLLLSCFLCLIRIGPNSTWLVSTRLDTTRHVRLCRASRALLFQHGGRRTSYSARLYKFSRFMLLHT